MLSLFFNEARSLRPVLLLPGIYGSNLYSTYDNFAKHWYCSSKTNHDIFWVNLKFVVPPIYNCLFEMMACKYDAATDKVTSADGLSVEIEDFGGENGISYVDTGVFGYHFIESFAPMIDYFKSKGYVLKKDLFGVPYDWRLALDPLREQFFPQLKQLVEEAYSKNGNQKVVILGYSCGGLMLHNFFTSYVNQDWKNKYVHKVIMLAPTFAGSSETLDVAWNQYFPIVPFIKNDIIRNSIQHVPVINALFPNHHVFQNDTIIVDPDGKEIKAPQLQDWLIKQGKYTGDAVEIVKKNLKWLQMKPESLGLPTYMIYNSGVDTTYQMKFKSGTWDDPEFTKQPGDGTVPAKGPEYACNNWKDNNGKPIVCHDVKNPGEDWEHAPLSTNDYIHQLIYNAANDLPENDWINLKGNWKFTSYNVETKNGTVLKSGSISKTRII